MKKQYKWLIPILILLTIVTVIYFVFFYHDANSLSRWQKHQIITAYKEDCLGTKMMSDPESFLERYYESSPLVWYDENGGVEEAQVIRYFRTYGNCIVLLKMEDNRDNLGKPIKSPVPLSGLSRTVFYPRECSIYLYNAKDPFDFEYSPNVRKTDIKMISLIFLDEYGVDNWLTEEQLEQLTDDLEAWIAKEHPDM